MAFFEKLKDKLGNVTNSLLSSDLDRIKVVGRLKAENAAAAASKKKYTEAELAEVRPSLEHVFATCNHLSPLSTACCTVSVICLSCPAESLPTAGPLLPVADPGAPKSPLHSLS